MLIYSLALKNVLDVSDTQFTFLEAVATEHGNIDKALELQSVSQEVKDAWKADQDFWNTVISLSTQLARSRALNLQYVKDQLLATIEGQKQPTKIQMSAINASIKLLQAGGGGIRAVKAEITPDSFKVSFEEGELSTKDAFTGNDDPLPDTPGDTQAGV